MTFLGSTSLRQKYVSPQDKLPSTHMWANPRSDFVSLDSGALGPWPQCYYIYLLYPGREVCSGSMQCLHPSTSNMSDLPMSGLSCLIVSWECQPSIWLFIIKSMSHIVSAGDTAVRFTMRMLGRKGLWSSAKQLLHFTGAHTGAWRNEHTDCFLEFEEGKVDIVYISY